MTETVCCPVFDPLPWNDKTHTWNDKIFLFAAVRQIFHMPIPGLYGRAINRLWSDAKKNDIAPDEKDFLLLAYDPSPWRSELYLSVTKEMKGLNVVRLSGRFISKVFDGPYADAPKYMKELDDYAQGQKKKLGRYYFYHTTCPKCAKKHEHNYIVVFGEVTD